ncbi:TetR/AcrR family transcriptional regulator [Virgibacillus salarius]|uniref:TetR/AcrR family transcriptional regulator n=1 Tax=Virgibacillus salarius TaxID=447199 RepID=UPI0004119BFD|nr:MULTISPECIES: TetR/AcrR family transcriptional regulator [Bacillaceae]WBX81909.1 TetR/AcrR family transcriptional regulator [Virgibacillus salarius]
MNEKKMKLIEAGMKLIAEKGYFNTSIQEIANEAGVSKGSFYIYFPSKEDFLTTAFLDFHRHITLEMKEAKSNGKTPKESFANQITVLIDYIYKHKDYIMMYFRENISIGQDMDNQICNLKIENFNWMKENLRDIYGNQLDVMIIDAVIQVEGLIHGYLKWLVIDDITIDKYRAGMFIVRRLDDLIKGMLENQEEPLVKASEIPSDYHNATEYERFKQPFLAALRKLESKVAELPLSRAKESQLYQVIQAIQNEADSNEPQTVVIQGLLAHFTGYPELNEEVKQIATVFDVELL